MKPRKRPAHPNPVPVEWVDDLRRGSRTRVASWTLHALTLALLLGAPYAHGLWRARAMRRGFSSAAACLLGTAPSRDGSAVGLDDPAGYFAATWLAHPSGWPASCRPHLVQLAEDPAWVLFPSVKSAEADVQKAAEILLDELDELPEQRDPAQRVPIRPLWALQMLRGTIREHTEAAGGAISHVPLATAAAEQQSRLPTPTVLSLEAAPDASLQVWGDDQEAQLAAFDATGVAYLRTSSESHTRARLPRSPGLRGAVSNGSDRYLVWTTAPEECGIGHCSSKVMGLAPLVEPLTRLPAPRWVAAHPFGRPSRSLAWQGSTFWMAAAEPSGTASLVEFSFVEGPDPEKNRDMPPLATRRRVVEHARDLVVYENGAGQLRALALVADSGKLHLTRHREAASERLAQLPDAWTSGWVRQCSASGPEANDTEFFVAGNGSEVLAGFVRGGETRVWHPMPANVAAPSRLDNPSQKRVQLVCDDPDRLSLVFVGEEGELAHITCRAGERSCRRHALAKEAAAFSALGTDAGTVVAYWSGENAPQVRTVLCDERGAPRADPFVPAPCWERWGGMCGAPVLARLGTRILLAAPSRFDRMTLESHDEGATWRALGSTRLLQPPGPDVLPK